MTPRVKSLFSYRLQSARALAHLTQAQLDHRAGLSLGMTSHYETGNRYPTLSNFRALCEALQVNGNWLLGLPTY